MAQNADTMDLTVVPTAHLRIALSEAILTGDEVNSAGIAAELARRREHPLSPITVSNSNSANQSRAVSLENNNNNNGNNTSSSNIPSKNVLSNNNNNGVVVGSLWGRQQQQTQQNNFGGPMWG